MSDIPGNRPEDEAWDNLFAEIGNGELTAEEAVRRWHSQPVMLAACKTATAYYEMLERATGIEHGVLAELRAAIAKAE